MIALRPKLEAAAQRCHELTPEQIAVAGVELVTTESLFQGARLLAVSVVAAFARVQQQISPTTEVSELRFRYGNTRGSIAASVSTVIPHLCRWVS